MKSLHVIRREYRENVRKKSFIIGTILVPVFMAALFVIPIVATLFVPDQQYSVTVLDETGEVGADFVGALNDSLKDGTLKYIASSVTGAQASRDELVSAVSRGELDILLVVRESTFSDGAVDYITQDVRHFSILESFENKLTEVVLKRRLAREGLDYNRVATLTTNVRLNIQQVSATGEVEDKDVLGDWGVVFVFIMILYMALLTWGVTISRSILEEKGSRIIEVLLSSLHPKELLFGKVVGVGLAGLTQLTIWALVGLTLSLYGGGATAALVAKLNISPVVFLYFILFFVLGFLLYSAIFTVIGAICSTDQDAQQLQGLVTMPMIVPIMLMFLIVENPNGMFATVLSLIPLFSPMVMLARVIILQPPWWQVALSIGLLVVSIYWAISFSSRIFRIGILMYGKRPNLREVVRWYRQAG